MTKKELQGIADTYGLYTEQDVENRVSCELLSIGTRNEELLKENSELKDKLKNLSKVAEVRLANWQKYEQENAELKAINEGYCRSRDRLASIGLPTFMSCKETVNKLKEAKDLIRNLLRVTYGEGWNYSLDVKVKAEQFLGGE